MKRYLHNIVTVVLPVYIKRMLVIRRKNTSLLNNFVYFPAHQNGGPPRAVSPMSVDGSSKTGAGGRIGDGRASPSPSLTSEKTLTEAEIVVRNYK